MLGALGRTVAHIVGDGVLTVSLLGDGRSVLKPDLDPRRTVGGFATLYPVAVGCTTRESADAMRVLNGVHDALTGVPHHGIGYGLLRHLYAPTARLFDAVPPPEILLRNEGAIPDLPTGAGPVRFDVDTAMPVREKVPGLGHAIELRVYRSSDGLHVDWWYDTRRLQRAKVEALAERFEGELRALVDEAMALSRADSESDGAIEELGLVDLSAE
jgi:phthiocerol/phenolphthiocerol synthesis type-I polyketide synthase E